MKIAVVILNWNGKALLERFLPAIITHTTNATIYVADNASTDDSIRFCETVYSNQVHIIKNATNGGYAGGYNEALKKIQADIYILLNSDVEVTENWLQSIIKIFKEDTTVAAVQPKIRDLKRPTHFEYAGAAGGYIDALGYPFCRGRIFDYCEEDTGQYDDNTSILWASGACLAIRSTVFWEVNGFDEDYFAHQEEIDLCWRIKNKGYHIMACGQSTVYHLGGATLSAASPKKTFYNFRNSLLTVVKNAPSKRYFLIVILRLILDGIAGVKFFAEAKPKHTFAIIQAHFSFYSLLPRFLNKRKQLQQKSEYAVYSSIIYAYFFKKIKTYTSLLEKR